MARPTIEMSHPDHGTAQIVAHKREQFEASGWSVGKPKKTVKRKKVSDDGES